MPILILFDDYTEALAEYKFNQKAQAQQQQANQQQQAPKIAQDWQSKVEKVRAVAPDFDEALPMSLKLLLHNQH